MKNNDYKISKYLIETINQLIIKYNKTSGIELTIDVLTDKIRVKNHIKNINDFFKEDIRIIAKMLLFLLDTLNFEQ